MRTKPKAKFDPSKFLPTPIKPADHVSRLNRNDFAQFCGMCGYRLDIEHSDLGNEQFTLIDAVTGSVVLYQGGELDAWAILAGERLWVLLNTLHDLHEHVVMPWPYVDPDPDLDRPERE